MEIHKRTHLITVLYVSGVLFSYSLSRFLPTIRLNQLLYFDLSRMLILAGSYLLFLWIVVARMDIDITSSKQDKLLYLFYFCLVWSVWWSIDQRETIRQLYWIFYLVLFYITLNIILIDKSAFFSTKNYFLIAPFVYLPICCIVFEMYGTLLPSKHLQFQSGYYFVGSFRKYAVASVEPVIPFLYTMIITGNKRMKLIGVLSCLCVLLVVLLGESRASLFVIPLMTIMYFATLFFKKRLTVRGLTLSILIPILLAITVMKTPQLQCIVSDYSTRLEGMYELRREGRYQLYKYGLVAISEKWFLGWGFGTDNVLSSRYKLYDSTGVPIGSHNFIITIWSGAGVLSLVIFLYLLFSVFKAFRSAILPHYIKLDNERLFILSIYVGFLGILAHGLVRPLLDNHTFYFFLALVSITEKWEASSQNT